MEFINIGLFGLGTVGSGIVEILSKNGEIISREIGKKIKLKKICVKDINKKRNLKLDKSILTSNPDDIINDKEIDIVVEVIGGIDDAKKIIEKSINNGKHIVSANKDLFALYGDEITSLAKTNGVHLLFEAAVAGGIPILKALQNDLYGNNIMKISGIVNGSTNYILTRMDIENLNLQDVVEEAKKLGFLEADPSADLEGLDAARKCAILATIGFNNLVTTNDVYTCGITDISLEDIKIARNMGYKIKLLATAENRKNGIVVMVHPTLLKNNHALASVDYELNSVYLEGDMVGETMFYGKGAGSLPTGSAVIGDLVLISKKITEKISPDYSYKIYNNKPILDIDQLSFSYFFRLNIKENIPEENKIRDILGDLGIKIDMINKINQNQYGIITKETPEIDFKNFKNSINNKLSLSSKIKEIRVLV